VPLHEPVGGAPASAPSWSWSSSRSQLV